MDAISSNLSVHSGLGTDRVQSVQPVKTAESRAPAVPDSSMVPSGLPSLSSLKQAESEGDQITISDQQVLKAIERAIKALEGKSTSLQFSVHDRTKQIMVKVLNSDTGEIIREIPPEKNLDFLAKLWEKAGILVDERR